MFWLITQRWSSLQKIVFYKGQINLFRALKWGIVRLCSSNIVRDMARNVNLSIWRFWVFRKENSSFLQNTFFSKTCHFWFLAISPAFFELQRCAIPHFNTLNKSIWHLWDKFFSRIDSFQVMRQNMCPIFFCPRLYYRLVP